MERYNEKYMKTTLLYMTDSYLRHATAKVLEKQVEGSTVRLVLDQTLFYAQGGGQPADNGIITGPHGVLNVSHVSYNGGTPTHLGKLDGEIAVGDDVTLDLDWQLRYKNMQMHTAGHILDQAVKNVVPQAIATDGVHGIGKKLYVTYIGSINADLQNNIQKQIKLILQKNLPIHLEMVTHDQLIQRHIKLPFDLPKNKDLRIMSIGEYPPMPDGGTQLHATGESWPITITTLEEKDGNTLVHYAVNQPQSIQPKIVEKQKTLNNSFAILLQHIRTNAEADGTREPETFRQKYLAKKGQLNELAVLLKNLPQQEKKTAGQQLNALKNHLETQLAKLLQQSSNIFGWVDMTVPGIKPHVGHVHPISQAMNEITTIFEKIGFIRVRYPEVDWEWYPFDSLNMPKDHPARDEWETFLVQNEYIHPTLGRIVLTPHTSNGQVREMQRLKSTPPIRMLNIARCYRRQVDVTHTEMFHHFEGFVVDKGITIQHLKGTIDHFAREFYGPKAKSRIRPFHFMFTEPSFEVDFSCTICDGAGKVKGEKCRFCKSGWHEVGGAGMVHPNVLKAGGINPDQYTGFAFGWGIERTYTLREGLKIDDIRLFYNGDMRFLDQF